MRQTILIFGIIFLLVGISINQSVAVLNSKIDLHTDNGKQQLRNYLSFATNPANPIDITFMEKFGGNSTDSGRFVQQTSDGGYIIVGYTDSFGAGDSDVYLIKTDRNGIRKWDRTFGGNLGDKGYCVQQTIDGGYIITGVTAGDVWLIKTDNIGNMVWEKTFGGKYVDVGFSVQQTNDGGYIITGVTHSYANYNDAWLIKTDSNGNMEWNRTFGEGFNDMAYCGQQTADGGYIITGETASDVWLLKTDSVGNRTWDVTTGLLEYDESRCVQQTSDGGYIITGYTYKFSYAYYFLIKKNSNGNTEWNKKFGGNYVQQTSDGGYIITRGTSGIGGDVLLIKTNSNGSKMWEKTYGFGAIIYDSVGYCVQQTSDGGYIITGETESFGNYYYDVLLIKTDKDGRPRVKSILSSPLLRFLEQYPLLNLLLQRLNIL
jgi:hypothetical protein